MSLFRRCSGPSVRALLFTASLLPAAMTLQAQVTYGGTYQVGISNHDVRSMAVDLNGVLYVDKAKNVRPVTKEEEEDEAEEFEAEAAEAT